MQIKICIFLDADFPRQLFLVEIILSVPGVGFPNADIFDFGNSYPNVCDAIYYSHFLRSNLNSG